MPYGILWRDYIQKLASQISDHSVSNGAAALAYYLMLAIFPALILLFGLIPYLPISHVDLAIRGLLLQMMPEEVVKLLTGVISDVTQHKRGGLLSLGALGTLWAASDGAYAIIQQLNIAYGVKESRSYFKVRILAIGLTLLVGLLVIVAFSLVVVGGEMQDWMFSLQSFVSHEWKPQLDLIFRILRWVIILFAFLSALNLTYYIGPNIQNRFKWVTPGSVFGVIVLIIASLIFRFYVSHFGKFSATYGSIGAIIIMMLWLYISGFVILVGSEMNALRDYYNNYKKL